MLNTNIKHEKLQQNTQKSNVIRCCLADGKLKLMDIHQEKGASKWLSTSPLKDEGYYFNKQEFWYLVKLRHSCSLSLLSTQCICGAQNDVQHAFSYKKIGFCSPETQSYQECNHWITHSSYQGCGNWASTTVTNWWNLWKRNSKHKWRCLVWYYCKEV